MRIALYSKIARRNIIKTRAEIEKLKIGYNYEDLRFYRNKIIQSDQDHEKQHTLSLDFYSLITFRDLLFHTQEHQFTIGEIREIIENYKLEFLNFIITDPLIKLKYLKNFPNDVMQNSLNNWEKFETDNPNIFNGMYQFWLKKN